jgi:hypothetical protein
MFRAYIMEEGTVHEKHERHEIKTDVEILYSEELLAEHPREECHQIPPKATVERIVLCSLFVPFVDSAYVL